MSMMLVAFLLLQAETKTQPAPQPRGGQIGSRIVAGPPEMQAGRPAWRWTVEERIAVRTNRDAARTRARLKIATAASSRVHADVISGAVHPELFMPTELFESVVRGAFLVDGWREVYRRDIAAAGLPDDFLGSLETIVASYLPLLRQQEALRRAQNGPVDRAVTAMRAASQERDLCRTRHAALTRARARYGESLDRFLYGPIARSRTMYFDDVSDPRELAAREAGCP